MGEPDLSAFNTITDSSYREQVVFFMNAFWPEYFADEIKDGKAKAKENREAVWKDYQLIIELDKQQHTARIEAKKAEGDWDEANSKGLEQNWAFKFFEMKKQTMTAIAFKSAFKTIDANSDGWMAAIEYLLYSYKQTVPELLKRPQATTPELEAAKEALKAIQAEIDKIEAKKESLRKKAEGTGVTAKNAKAELAQLYVSNFEDINITCVKAESQLKKAAKKVKSAPGSIWFMQREIEEQRKYSPKPMSE
eukprot:gb/GEZN01005363.1/.p1 GENE.gb/GEZN01005363.1/~~gb/GEZN01005363.1/.p1  ORF type:complete len:250 (-),score=66.27 gb/GEZN01005363.1/:560-1309(-)